MSDRPASGRPVRRVVAGVMLTSTADGVWVTDDGHYEVRRDLEWSVCEGPHPVRTGRGQGYMCLGEQEHGTPEWGVWDLRRNDWVDSIEHSRTMKEVAAPLANRIKAERGMK